MRAGNQHNAILSVAKRPRRQAPLLDRKRKTQWVTINQNARAGGTFVLAPSGWGKSRLIGRNLCFQDAMSGVGTVLLDVVGGSISNFLDKCLYLPETQHRELRSRIRYINLAGYKGFVPSFPMLAKQNASESLVTTASRIADLIRQTDKNFARATIMGLPRTEPLLTGVCKVLTALDLPISHADDLLLRTDLWVGRINEAVRRNPEARSGQKELMDYLALSEKDRELRSEPFRNRLHLMRHNEVMRAIFASTREPTIDWERVATQGEVVLVDLSDFTSDAAREFALFWVWNSLLDYISSRKSIGRLYPPLSVYLDELSFFTTGEQLNTDAFASKFSEMADVRMRNASIYLTVATQYMDQLPEKVLKACQNLKTHLYGAVANPKEAEELAERWFPKHLWEVKHWRTVWGSDNYRGKSTYYPIASEPEFLSIPEQNYRNSRTFTDLPHGSWLVAVSEGEGELAGIPRQISTKNLDPRQFDTQHPREIEELKTYLTKRDLVPMSDVLGELEEQEQLFARREQRTVPLTFGDLVHALEGDTRAQTPSGNGEELTESEPYPRSAPDRRALGNGEVWDPPRPTTGRKRRLSEE